MNDEVRKRLTRRELWMRALYMLFFLIAYSVAEVVLTLVVVFQFFMVLITGRANEVALALGENLSAYLYQVFRYLTFNSQIQPFPFSDWPDEPREDNPWTQAYPVKIVEASDADAGVESPEDPSPH